MDQNLAVSNHGGCSVVVVALVLSFACGQIVSQFTFDQVKKVTSILVENSTLETRFSEPRFSEILDLMNKLQLPFSYFTL